MDCMITSWDTNKARCKGMSLVEVMVASGLGSLVLSAVMAITFFSARSFAAVSNYVDLDAKSRMALDKMSQEIRQADALTSCGRVGNKTEAVFTGKDPLTGAPYTLTYTHQQNLKTLTCTRNAGTPQVLLTECDSIDWYMYKGGMTNGTDSPILTTDPTQCKVVQLTWACSRKIFGNKANTESVQSAEIVIRKK